MAKNLLLHGLGFLIMGGESDKGNEFQALRKQLREMEKRLPPEYRRYLALKRKLDKLKDEMDKGR